MQNLGSLTFKDDYGKEAVVTEWLTAWDMKFCQQGVKHLSLWDDKCLIRGGDYVEKRWDSSIIKSELFLLELQIKNVKMCHPNLTIFVGL
jgi:hypothetical protein